MKSNLTLFHGKHLLVLLLCLFVSVGSFAIPAWNGWQTKHQPDGTAIVVRMIGDEFYHYWETQDGKLAIRNADGTFVVSDEPLPSEEQIEGRRKASPMYGSQPRKTIGVTNQAPRGLVILVQFADDEEDATRNAKFDEANDKQGFVDLLNKVGYDYDGGTGSARDYFIAQSNGKYTPDFDVYGPVTLSNPAIYYGKQDPKNSSINDMYMGDFVIEATTRADELGCDFTQYDSDNDGEVDIVYFFYAGKGQAAGGEDWTIWPHNWNLYSALVYGRTHNPTTYTYSYKHMLDGKRVNNYACSAELKNDGNRSGVGTFCHEFSHVLGLPDYYDTSIAQFYRLSHQTPNIWSLMDYGSYSNNERTPPSYSIFDKYFMGWATPKVLPKDANLNAEITSAYGDGYQLVRGVEKVPWNHADTVYYLEYRQQTGWDAPLPGHGMLVWRVVYDYQRWRDNQVNKHDSTQMVRYTVVSARGDLVGAASEYGLTGEQDLFPYKTYNSFSPFTGSEVKNISEADGTIYFQMNDGGTCRDVETNITGTEYSAATCVPSNVPLVVTFAPETGEYDVTSLTITIGSYTLVNGTDYELTDDNRRLTVFASAIAAHEGTITVTSEWAKTRFTYTFSAYHQHCEVPANGVVPMYGELNLIVTPEEGYILSDSPCWTVRAGTTYLKYGTDFTYDPETHILHFASVPDNLTINVTGYPPLNWYTDGELYKVTANNGAKIYTIPTAPSCTSGRGFAGWCTTDQYEGTDAPTLLKGGDSAPESGAFYAVYGKLGKAEIAQSITLDGTSSTSLPQAYGNEASSYVTDMTVKAHQVSKNNNSGVIKWRGAEEPEGAGYVYPLYENYDHPKIHSIVITYNRKDQYRNISVKVGSASNPTEGRTITPSINGDVYTFNCVKGGLCEFFLLTNGEHEAFVDKIVVNYADMPGFENYSTSCALTLPTYTVTFLNDDDSQIGEPRVVEEGDAAIPPVLERECYRLTWDKDYSYVTEDMTVKAVWLPNYEYSWSVTSSDETKGTVAYLKEPTCSDLSFTVKATPAEGCAFIAWSDGVTDAERTVILTQDTVLVANFGKIWTITWYNHDETLLATTQVPNGVTPTYPDDAPIPTKDPTTTKTYSFNGWTPSPSSATKDASYTAYFVEHTRYYTVTFMDGDKVLRTVNYVQYGGSVSAPYVASRDCYTYAWDRDFSNVTEDMTVNLIWTFDLGFTWDIQSEDEDKGTVTITQEPTCDDKKVIFRADAKDGYAFLQWSDGEKSNPRTKYLSKGNNFKVTAQWTKGWKITWKDWDGTELRTDNVKDGDTPKYGSSPSRPSDERYNYYFNEWTPTIVPATEDAEYTATYNQYNRSFTIIFQDADGNELYRTSASYGATHVSAPKVEILDCQQLAWDQDFSVITHDMVITAIITDKPAPYTWSITSSDEAKGTVSVTKEPTACDLTITFQADPKDGYKFLKWSDENTSSVRSFELTGDTALQAQWEVDSTTGIGDVQSDNVQCTKLLRDEQILILRDGKTYTVTGQLVK